MGLFSWVGSVARFSGRCVGATARFAWRHKRDIAGATVLMVAGAAAVSYGLAYWAAAAGTLATVEAGAMIATAGVAVAIPVVGAVVETGRHVVRKVKAWKERRNTATRDRQREANTSAAEAAEAAQETNERLDRLIPTMEANATTTAEAVRFMRTQQQADRERMQEVGQQVQRNTAENAQLRTENAVLRDRLNRLDPQQGDAPDPAESDDESFESVTVPAPAPAPAP